MFKRMSEVFSAMKQLHGMSDMAKDVAEKLNRERVVGQAGGGMVEIEMTGAGGLVRVRIAPELVAKGDHEMVEDLVAAAFQQASTKAQECSNRVLQSMARDLPMGNLSGLMESLAGGMTADSEASDASGVDEDDSDDPHTITV